MSNNDAITTSAVTASAEPAVSPASLHDWLPEKFHVTREDGRP